MIAYSYGCVIAVETIALFEANRQKVKVIFVDGSPDFVLAPFAVYRQHLNLFEFDFAMSFIQQLLLDQEMPENWTVSRPLSCQKQ